VNQGPRGDCLMKKTEGQKSRDTVPLKRIGTFLQHPSHQRPWTTRGTRRRSWPRWRRHAVLTMVQTTTVEDVNISYRNRYSSKYAGIPVPVAWLKLYRGKNNFWLMFGKTLVFVISFLIFFLPSDPDLHFYSTEINPNAGKKQHFHKILRQRKNFFTSIFRRA
jgi:hypothetical protein